MTQHRFQNGGYPLTESIARIYIERHTGGAEMAIAAPERTADAILRRWPGCAKRDALIEVLKSITITPAGCLDGRHPLQIKQHSCVQGRLIELEGQGTFVSAVLEGANGERLPCMAMPEQGERLKSHIDRPVRLRGIGHWERHDDRHWRLLVLHVANFEPLRDESLRESVDRIRSRNSGPESPDGN